MRRAPTNAPELLVKKHLMMMIAMEMMREDAMADVKTDLISMGWLGRERFGEADTGKLQFAPDHHHDHYHDDDDYHDFKVWGGGSALCKSSDFNVHTGTYI